MLPLGPDCRAAAALRLASQPPHAAGWGRTDYNDHIVKSTTIGIREAKAQLSRLVREAERGAEWIITDRGRPVAKLAPARDLRLPVEQRLGQLESWGWIEPSTARPRRLPAPVRIAADAQRALQDDRGA